MKLITNGTDLNWQVGQLFDLGNVVTMLHPRLLTDNNKDITNTIYAYKIDGKDSIKTAMPGTYFATLNIYYHYQGKNFNFKQELQFDVEEKKLNMKAPR